MLTIILGRIHGGKTRSVLRRAQECICAGKHVVLVVPDQATYSAEKALCGGHGTNAEVLSFNRLCDRILRSALRPARVRLTDGGRAMLLTIAVNSCRDRLTVFRTAADRSGFCERMLRMIALLDSCRISEEHLLSFSDSDTFLGRKLRDTVLIRQKYHELLQQGYSDNNGRLAEAAEAVNCPFLDNTAIFIDGFEVLTAQMLSLVQALLTRCDVTVAVCDSRGGTDSSLYAVPERLTASLFEAASKAGVSASKVYAQPPAPRTPELEHLAQLWSLPAVPFAGECNAITYYCADDRSSEVLYAASYIKERVQKGARFRDFGIVCDKLYYPVIERVFSACNIPVFLDTVRPMRAQPCAALVLSSLAAALDGDSADFCDCLSNVLFPAPREDAERLYELIVSLDVKPAELLSGVINRGDPEEFRRLSAVFAPVVRLKEGLKGDFSAALRAFIVDEHLPEGVAALIERCEKAGMLSEADEYRQVWDNINEILEQLELTAGNPDARTAAMLFVKSMDSQKCGIIPPTVDCVSVGDAARSRFSGAPIVMLIGVNEGVLPPAPVAEGLLSPAETAAVNNGEKLLTPDLSDSYNINIFDLCGAMQRAERELLVSCSLADDGGAHLRPSVLIRRLRAAFPTLRTHTEDPSLQFADFARDSIASSLSSGLSDAQCAAAAYLYGEGKLRDAERALAFRPEESIPAELAERLLPEIASCSFLETVAECPLRGYCQYGLRLRDDARYLGGDIEIGDVIHRTLQQSVLTLARGSGPETIASVVKRCMENADLEQTGGVLSSTALNRVIMNNIRSEIEVICREVLCDPRYTKSLCEFGFGNDGSFSLSGNPPLKIRGSIDRVDIAQDGGICITDYKSSAKTITRETIDLGTTLQLPLYLVAAVRMLSEHDGTSLAENRPYGEGMLYRTAIRREGEPMSSGITAEKAGADNFSALLELAADRARELAQTARSSIAPYPLQLSRESACTYCQYVSLCPKGMCGIRKRKAVKNHNESAE